MAIARNLHQPTGIGAGLNRRPRMLLMALMAGVGVLLNNLPISLFYGIHVLLGSIPAALAVLLWRSPWAIAIGALASVHTWTLWGHPWAIVIFSLEIAWLLFCSCRWNGPRIHDGNGRILLFAISYWLLIGSPLVGLFYGLIMKIDPVNTLTVAIKQSFNGILNTGIAFGIFLFIQARRSQLRQGPGVSLRGVSMMLTLSAISVPTLITSALAGRRLELLSQQVIIENLKAANLSIAETVEALTARDETTNLQPTSAGASPTLAPIAGVIGYQIITGRGERISSDPQLFNRINNSFTDGGRDHITSNELSILIPKTPGPTLKKWINGYWSYSQQYEMPPARGSLRTPASLMGQGGKAQGFLVQVVRPARPVVEQVQDQSSQLLGAALMVMVIGGLISDRAGWIISREFERVTTPLRNKNNELQDLKLSIIMEIRHLSMMIKHRLRQVNRLSADLRTSNRQLKASKSALEELLTRDPLTGCGTAKALEERLIEEWHRFQRTKDPFCCLWINLDGFRTTNALVGQETGNSLLRCVASALAKRLRITDHLFRWQNDQFVVIATGCYPDDGCRLGRMLQQTIEDIYLESEGDQQRPQQHNPADASTDRYGEIRLSASVGVSCAIGDHTTAQQLLEASRSAMETARAAGPGRLGCAAEGEPET